MNSEEKEICRLCGENATPFFGNEFYQCKVCKGISRKSTSLPDSAKEKNRYDHHQNSPDDGYIDFISPLIQSILKNISPAKKGLDYGCGPDSVISKILSDKKFQMEKFDPFYENHPEILKTEFDFIVAIEVVEHFHFPKNEFILLKNILNEKGELFIMTHLYDSTINFEKWYYKNDFTHVFFYTRETFEWIKKEYNYSELEINGRFIRLKN